jgi:uncharacterized protein
MNENFTGIFPKGKPIIGMVHVKALPGAPLYDSAKGLHSIVQDAVDDAKRLIEAGIDGIQIENQWDRPFVKPASIGPETIAVITNIATLISQLSTTPIGINIHINGCNQAIAIALATGAKWIRAFELANSYISNSGFIDAAAPDLMRYRRNIDAQSVMVFGDFQVKHGSHAITADRTIIEKAHDIEESLAHAAIITGAATGEPPNADLCKEVKNSIQIPLLIGSGLSIDNLEKLWPHVDGAIIGSSFKLDGKLQNPVSVQRVKDFIKKAREIE